MFGRKAALAVASLLFALPLAFSAWNTSVDLVSFHVLPASLGTGLHQQGQVQHHFLGQQQASERDQAALEAVS